MERIRRRGRWIVIPLRAHAPGRLAQERQQHQPPPPPPTRQPDEPIHLYGQRLICYMIATRNPYPMTDEQLELVRYAAIQANAAKYEDPRVYQHIGAAERLAHDVLIARQRDRAQQIAAIPEPTPTRTDTIGPMAPVPVHPAPTKPAPGTTVTINF